MVIAKNVGMRPASNFNHLEVGNLKFIVGSRVMRAPADLAGHFHRNGDVLAAGQVIDVVTQRHAKGGFNDVSPGAELAR